MSSHSDPEATQPQQPLSGSLGLEATSAPFPASSTAENQGALTALLRAIRLSQGQFSLVLAHCNYETLRDRVIKALCQEADLSLGFVHLPPETYSLLAALKAGSADLSPPSRQPPAQNPDQNLTQNPDQNLADAQVQSSAQNLDQNLTQNPNQTSAQTQALVVLGLDQVSEVAQVLKAANQVREEFRRALPFAVVVWVNDSIFKQLMRQAPDLENWATPIHFTLSSAALLQQIQHATDAIFAQILEAGAGRFVNAVNVYPDGQGDGQIEALSAARRSLERARIQPDALLEASLEFVLGQATWSQPAVSRQHYERSLALWPAEQSLSRRGCVLFHLGLWWRADAVRHRERYTEACERSRDYFQQAIATFRRSHRFDLEARFINALAEVLQRLEQWPELEQVARRSLTLHQQGVELASLEAGQFDPSVRLAHDHGLLADVALSQDQWPMAQHHAEQALDILEQVDRAVDGAIAAKSYRPDDTLNWARAYHRQQYHFSLARALLGQNNYHSAITQLEIAQRLGNPQHDPLLYIRIAKQLRALYYQQKRYLEAFHIRQVYRTVEQQYGLRAFTGAGRLQPQQSVQSPALAVTNEPETIPLEIVAAGRQADVEHLMQRIYRPDCKLTVIYGQSGVGKSSMIAAGLMPMLQQQVVGSREVVPILLQIYDQWPKQLGEAVAIALFGHGTGALSASSGSADQESDEDEPTRLLIESAPAILAQLRVSTKNNRFMVLVFDQFEEFFAAAPSLAQQRRFYEFLEKCLALPYVKVVLSLREDYIHNLLECNRRVNLDIIDNNILDKSILYYIGNFSKASAHQLIYQLTRQAQFHLEPALIERLVEDLAEDLTGELGEVRPIELQVLGDQLQTENITTLAQYEHCGDGDRSPKAVLMDRYLDSVIRDCGEENRRAAELVLYWLTDEAETRPLRTKAELAAHLGAEAPKLELVLNIYVHSGIVLLLPAHPIERYQLVHDYLVAMIRRQRGSRLLSEIAALQQQDIAHKNAIARQQKLLRNGAIMLLISFVSVTVLGGLVNRIRTQNQQIRLGLAANEALDLYDISQTEGLFAALDAAQTLQNTRVTDPERVAVVPLALQQMLHQITQDYSFITDQSEILALSVHPDGSELITADAEGFVKIWTAAGQLQTVLPMQPAAVWDVEYSPDGSSFATVGDSGMVSRWSRQGDLLNQWPIQLPPSGTDSNAQSLSQSQVAAPQTAAIDSLAYHPEGDRLLIGGVDGSVSLWRTDGTLVTHWQTADAVINDVAFAPSGDRIATASDTGTVQLWDLDGNLLQTLTHEAGVYGLSFHPRGTQLASVDRSGNIQLWDLPQGTLLRTLKDGTQALTSVAYTQSGDRLMVAGDLGIVQLWDQRGYKLGDLIGHQSWVWALKGKANGQFVSADISGKVQVWDVSDRALNRWTAYDGVAWSVNFSPDGNQLITAGSTGTATRWSVNGDRLTLYPIDPDEPSSATNLYWADFSPDGQRIFTAGADGAARIWPASGEQIARLDHGEAQVNAVAVSPDGQTVATADSSGSARLWQATGELQASLMNHGGKGVVSVSFSPDGRFLATAGRDRSAVIWDIAARQSLMRLEGHQDTVAWVDFSPDGQTVVTASHDGTARLWDIEGNLITELIGHSRRITWAGFSPSGDRIATASADGTVILWRYQEEQTYPERQFQSYSGEAFSAAFNPDESMLAIADSTGNITLWPIEDLAMLIERGCDWVSRFRLPATDEFSGQRQIQSECLNN